MSNDIEHHPVERESLQVVDEKYVESRDVDEAYKFLQDNAVQVGEVEEISDKKLMRKVDWMVMPLMFACYYLQYSDKTLRKFKTALYILPL